MINQELQNQVLGLKALEKIHLVELILESLDKPDLLVQEKWIEESEKRFDAYKAGKIKALSYEDVMNRLKNES
jgi:putative addiction module component (TIGR02574 family)